MNSSIKKQALYFAAVCLALLLGYVAWHRGFRRIDLEKLFGGAANVNVIRSPDKLQVWQTIGFLKSSEAHDLDISDYRKKGGAPIVVPDSLTKSFSEKLSNPSSYYHDLGSSKSCIPLPGFVLAFARGERQVNVFLCFECDILMVESGDFKAEADFDLSHNELLRLIKQLYPKDERVQKLLDRKRH